MKEFITALQFLTRINLFRQDEVSPESFGRSVKFFPLVGAVIGFVLAGFDYLTEGYLPIHVLAAIIIIVEILLTGGLHGDGLMDTMDGIFSVRSRERMLEIMKDSRVGANGAMAFSMFLLLKWSLLLDLLPVASSTALFVMPVLGRFAMVIGITVFPYARPEGIGKAFAQYAGRDTLYFAAALTLLLILSFGTAALVSLVAVIAFTMIFARYVTKLLGGLTGDVYGAITELAGIVVLIVFLLEREMGMFWLK